MRETAFRALVFTGLAIYVLAIILLTASIFAAPDVGYSGAVVDGTKLSFVTVSVTNTNYITYYSSAYGYQARVIIALGNNITLLSSTGATCSVITDEPELYYVVGAVDSANTHYVYVYNSSGSLVKNCNLGSGIIFTRIVSPAAVVWLKYFSTSATSGGFQDALNYYINNVDPAIHDAGTGSIAIFWGNFSGNLPVSLNFTVNGQSVNAFIWGGGENLQTYWLVESNESVGVVTNHYSFTAALGHTYYLHDENWAESGETEESTANLTLTVEAYDEYTGNNVTGDVYINGSLAGKTFQSLSVPNATLNVKVVAAGYEAREFLTAPGRVIVYLKPYSSPSSVHVVFKAYDAVSGAAVDAVFTEGFSSWHSGENVTLTAGTHTITASASGYKPLRFTVFLSGDAEIPVYLVKTDSDANGGVGYNPSQVTINDTNSPDSAVASGCNVGFHFINPSSTPVDIHIVATTRSSIGFTYTKQIDELTLPGGTGYYKYYSIPDVARSLGMIGGPSLGICDRSSASLYEFTILANGKKVAVVPGDAAYGQYVDIYVSQPPNASYTAGWGWTSSTLGIPSTLLDKLMPILFIVLIFAVIQQALKRR